MFEDTMKGGKNVSNPELVKILAERSADSIKWLADRGAVLSHVGRGGGVVVDGKRIEIDQGRNAFEGRIVLGAQRKVVHRGQVFGRQFVGFQKRKQGRPQIFIGDEHISLGNRIGRGRHNDVVVGKRLFIGAGSQ